MGVAGMLGPFGVAADEEALYLWLLAHPGQAPAADLHSALDALREHGLIVPEAGGRWSALPPDIAVEVLGCVQLHRARQAAGPLMRMYRTPDTPPDDMIEVVQGAHAIRVRVERILGCAHWEVSFFDKPPHLVATSDLSQELAVLRRGIAVRAIYERTALPARRAAIGRLVAAGEQVRFVASVPFKLLVVDRRWAIVPVYRGDEIHRAILVRGSPILDALQSTFDGYWRRAATLPEKASPADDTDRALLALLAAGLPDQAIARDLGVGLRTVQRRVSALMRRFGAQTRFQAGLYAARHGLL
jgi:DNA-binding CsgD family transcriptional regulator